MCKSNMSPLVTVIIPVYNAAAYLHQCVSSVLRQTYEDLEIILIDDGSTDDSGSICQEYADADGRIHFIQQVNKGVSEARNVAISVATGKYIAFVDSDDWIDTQTIAAAVCRAEEEKADLVIWSYCREYRDKTLPRDVCSLLKDLSENEIKRRFFGLHGKEVANPEQLDSLCTLWGKLYRRECINKANAKFVDLAEIGTGEDILFNMDVSSCIERIVLLHGFFYHYRKYNAGSVTTKYKENLWKKWNKQYEYANDILLRNYPANDTYRKALQSRVAINIVAFSLNTLSKHASLKDKMTELNEVLCSTRYREAIAEVEIRHMPSYWKVFFLCARMKWAGGILFLCKCISILKARV